MSENSEKNTKITPVERTDGRKVTLSQNASKASADGAEHAPQGGFGAQKIWRYRNADSFRTHLL